MSGMSGIFGGDVFFGAKVDLGSLQRTVGQMGGVLQSSMSSIAGKLQSTGAALGSFGRLAAGAIGSAVKETVSFQEGMANIATLGVQDLDTLGGEIRDVTKEFGLDLGNAVTATYQAISAGADSAEVPKLLAESAKAATAAQVDLQTAVELGTATTNAYGLELGKVNKVYDQAFIAVQKGVTTFGELSGAVGQLAPIFSAAKIPTEELFSSIAALTLGGVQTSRAVTQLKAAVSNVIKPTAEASKMAESLGLEFNSTALASKGLAGFLQDVKEKTGGNVDKMSVLFGSVEGLQAILALTGNQAGAFASILQDMENEVWGSTQAFQAFVKANPSHAWKILNAQVKDLKVGIGTQLLPVLNSLVRDHVQPMVKSMGEWVEKNPELTAQIGKWTIAATGLSLVLSPLLSSLASISIIMTNVSSGIAWLAGTSGFVALSAAITAGAAAVIVATTTYAVMAMTLYKLQDAFVGAYEAWQGKKNAEVEAEAAELRMINTLRAQGVAVDYVTYKSMNQADAMRYVKKAQDSARESTLLATATAKGQGDTYWQVSQYAKKMGISVGQAMQKIEYSTDESTASIRESLKRLSLDHRESPSINDLVSSSLNNYLEIWHSRLSSLQKFVGGFASWMRETLGDLAKMFGVDGLGGMMGAAMSPVAPMAGKLASNASTSGGIVMNSSLENVTVQVSGVSGASVAESIARELPKILMKQTRLRAQQRGISFGV